MLEFIKKITKILKETIKLVLNMITEICQNWKNHLWGILFLLLFITLLILFWHYGLRGLWKKLFAPKQIICIECEDEKVKKKFWIDFQPHHGICYKCASNYLDKHKAKAFDKVITQITDKINELNPKNELTKITPENNQNEIKTKK